MMGARGNPSILESVATRGGGAFTTEISRRAKVFPPQGSHKTGLVDIPPH